MSVSFDMNKFGDAMHNQSDIALDSYDGSAHGWKDKSGSAMHYKHARKGASDWEYRTWRQDVSVFYKSAGILVSCKIDHDRSGNDDHVVVIASFNLSGQFISGQASVQRGSDAKNAQTARFTSDSTSDIPSAVGNAVLQGIKGFEGKDSDDGLEYLGTIATINLRCLASAVVVH